MKPVVTHACSNRRYNPSDLTEYLDDLAVLDSDTEENASTKWAQQLQDTPLKIDLDAVIPEAQLERGSRLTRGSRKRGSDSGLICRIKVSQLMI